MRTPRVLLLTGLAAVVCAIAAAVASATPPGSGYAWSQPGCAPATTCCSQPSFAVGYFLLNSPSAGMAYAWAQPGAAAVTAPDAQPAPH
jgi:hypothetical protein